ncbi:carotenoid oxygenase family protein [Variovorax sp. Sphag1AA]|uniref:carotenoid oxygenase family protein n=1 Tax=Variovorax sp. Sphag1AA TaxID=2587027 RepID=UPI00161EA785|nr:carotenoid oxygenase family protein [Variovorax sp. Sphag1AA]MBB3178751.1 carotenoid cleavage dioxygenase [Variovorax sp. Sphag1AA]
MSHQLTRRSFHRLAASGAALIGSHALWPLAHADEPADVPWTSDDPHLSGNFLPVQREVDARDLRVISGRIPADLRGVYMRNGPNPEFKPLGYAYPLDGDGMIHAVYIEDGKARYRNRFVDTESLKVERRAGHAVFGSFTHPVPVDPAMFAPGEVPSQLKNGAFVNIIRHGGRLIALNEATTSYEMSMELDTLGQWTAGGTEPLRLGAHNRHHPRTGDLYALEYSWRTPMVKFHRIDPSGKLVSTRSVEMPMPTMIHDFILTERYIVLIAGPAVFDAQAAKAGKSMLQWRPDLGMRIALLPLDGGAPTWIEGDPFFVFHFGNGFERGGRIVVDYVHHESFALVHGKDATLRRLTIDPARRSFKVHQFSDEVTEFPRVNHLYEALPTRYVYVPTLTSSLKLPDPPSAVFNTVLKFDTETGRSSRHDLGNQIVGEAAFVPRPGGHREDDGYLAAFTYDPARRSSNFVLLDARRIEEAPVAVIEMPQRVPQGLHGNWITRT